MFRLPDFKQVVRDAGLTRSEVATLYGVSRQTVYGWLDGSVPRPGSPMDRMAGTITLALLHAIQQRTLPMPALDSVMRKRRIAKMSMTLRNLKPAPVRT